ncbi:MAG: spermine synthase [Chthoniobacteraceae bacterium]|nr:spermine synthase [Chthoniobacteraceae bacterium]
MIPFQTLAQIRTPDGSHITLHEHDGEYFMKHNGRQLMSSTATASELLLADLGCEHLRDHDRPRILIGGLGLGYTLKRVLEIVVPTAVVHVAELFPEVVEWNRQYLGALNGKLLEDRRVKVLVQDVFQVIREAATAGRYNAILLDVDHTPASLVQAKNARLYDRHGYALLAKALKPAGRAAFWSATEEPGFIPRLNQAGFEVKAYEAKAHERAKRAAHRIYVAEQRAVGEPVPPAKTSRPK